jgi:co-chaperonin GroES (HSP10)
MKLKAIGDKIIVERDPPKECAEGGILIPETLERTPRFNPTDMATVVSVGPRCPYPAIAVGTRIAIKTAWGDDYFHDDRTLTILSEREYRDCCIEHA